jgi:hypothetical protein
MPSVACDHEKAGNAGPVLAHRVISLPYGILSLSGNSRHRSVGWVGGEAANPPLQRTTGHDLLICTTYRVARRRVKPSAFALRATADKSASTRPTDLCDLPDGQISQSSVCRLSRSRAKNFPLCPSGKSSLPTRPVPPRQEGRFAIVTDVECGMRWTWMAPLTNGAIADGQAVWS